MSCAITGAMLIELNKIGQMLKEKIDISSIYQNKSPNVSLNDNQNANNQKAGDLINNSWIVPISNSESIIFPIPILILGAAVCFYSVVKQRTELNSAVRTSEGTWINQSLPFLVLSEEDPAMIFQN